MPYLCPSRIPKEMSSFVLRPLLTVMVSQTFLVFDNLENFED